MKKTLVALAALAATASFAQSSVTITGNLDFAYSNTTGTSLTNNGTTFATTTGTGSTSVINLDAIEDLGGGMKATVHYGLDPRTLANDGLGVTNAKTNVTSNGNAIVADTVIGTTTGANTATGLGRDEVYIGLSGGFGNLRLGSPNSISLNTHQVASPLGTGIGSGYAQISQLSAVTTRFNRSVRYDSPVMSGFSVSALYAPGDDTAATATNAAVALGIPNNRNVTEVALAYANGPLNVQAANISQAAQTNATGFYSSATLANSAKTSSNMLSANYTIGATTLYAGFINGDAIAASATPSTVKSSRVAIKHTMGAVAVIVQAQDLTTTTAAGAETKATLSGARVDYSFSKTTVAYLGYQKYDSGAAYSTSALTGGDNTTVSIGLRKSF